MNQQEPGSGRRRKADKRPKKVEEIPFDADEETLEAAGLDEETMEDLLHDALEDAYDDEIESYTDDEGIREIFEEGQDLDAEGEEWEEELSQYNATSPELSGGDVDAAWQDANVGEETVGGSVSTPDQDEVDELGEAAGLTYGLEEPLHTGDILERRDRDRWELDPRSAEEDEEDE